jgi:hypothetical protein
VIERPSKPGRIVVDDSVIPEWDCVAVVGGTEFILLSPDVVKADTLGEKRTGLLFAIPRFARWVWHALVGHDSVALIRAQCVAIVPEHQRASVRLLSPMEMLHLRNRYIALQQAYATAEHMATLDRGRDSFAPRGSRTADPMPGNGASQWRPREGHIEIRPGVRLPGYMGGGIAGQPLNAGAGGAN